MTHPKKQVAIIAPERILNALIILIRSAPNLDILVTDTRIDSIRSDLAKFIPEVFLLYLPNNDNRLKFGGTSYQDIQELTQKYPDANYIVVIENKQNREKVQALGVDSVLFEGVNPREILAAIDYLDQTIF